MNLKVATWLCIIVGGSAIASAQKTDLPSLVKKIKPSVVTIEVDGLCKAAGCQGTGFYVGSGRVATNYHVISGISEGAVRLVSGTTVPIKGILYANSDHDIAILQVGSTTEATPALSFAAADPEQGATVIVIGSPRGLEQSVTTGIVSAIRGAGSPLEYVQISAPISPGSSGSPVLAEDGSVVGIATSALVDANDVNMAVAANHLRAAFVAAAKAKPREPAEFGKAEAGAVFEAFKKMPVVAEGDASAAEIILKTHPFNAAVRFALARALVIGTRAAPSDCDRALQEYDRAVELRAYLPPDQTQVAWSSYAMLHSVLGAKGRNDDALRIGDELLLISSKFSQPYYWKSSDLMKKGELAEAAETCQDGVKQCPEDVELRCTLVRIYVRRHDHAAAVAALKDARHAFVGLSELAKASPYGYRIELEELAKLVGP